MVMTHVLADGTKLLRSPMALAWPRSNVFIDEDFKNSDKEIVEIY